MPSDSRAAMILCSHDLGPTPSADPGERAYWFGFNDYRLLVEQLAERAEDQGFRLELTTDDGFASDYERLLPWLIDTGRTATFFVPVGFLDRPGRLTSAQLCEIAAAGMTIGGHGYDHLDWPTIDEAAFKHEIEDAKARLEDLLGQEVKRVAPPYGSYDTRVLKALREAGFAEIYTTRGGFSLPLGRLKPRIVLQQAQKRLAQLSALSQRRPGTRDRLRCGLHEVQARFT